MTPLHAPRKHSRSRLARHLAVGAGLATFVLLLYFPLLFTNRVLASGDILLYFYPYRDFASEALRSGSVPLWNPYLFLGAPFLANPQAAVLYPLHWPLSWLSVTKQIYWSAAIHTWLLGMGGYLLMRRWGMGVWAGAATGLVLAGSGFFGGLMGHLNQMNVAAWLPWGVAILDARVRAYDSSSTPQPAQGNGLTMLAGPVARFGLLVALMLLAGHTQMAYINLFGLGAWVLWQTAGRFRMMDFRLTDFRLTMSALRANLAIVQVLLVFTGGCVLGLLLSGAQLLPTVELSGLGLRSGGLTYAEATSFSLKPLHLLWTLLPTYGFFPMEAIFDTPAYTEFIAYVGLAGLALALIGAWYGTGTPRAFGLFFAGLGLLLALGRWNPLYYVLYIAVPGFDLFRTPARWMMLYTLGTAVLAGVGMAWLGSVGLGRLRQFLKLDGAKLSIAIPYMLPFILFALTADLLLAARALPHAQPTAPQAVYGVRTAPAHLLTDPVRTAVGAAAMGRFLGMSTITYDPGDMADWRSILLEQPPPQLNPQTFADFVIALKMQELVVPNLPLLWRIPAVDGFDGGVLPLQQYNDFLTLFIPRDELIPDGRLREQLKTVPSTRLLNLLNAQYLVTDKVRDLWFRDIFYDRQIGARLHSGYERVTIETPQPFAATHIGLIGYVDAAPTDLARLAAQNATVAAVTVTSPDGQVEFPLVAGGQTGAHLADGGLDSPMAANSGATVAYRDVEGDRQEYLAIFALPAPVTPTAVEVQRLSTAMDVMVQAVTLIDERTGMFTSLLPSDRGRFRLVHSGDVKIYENLDLLPRAYLVHNVIGVADAGAALAQLRDSNAAPGDMAVVEGVESFHTETTAGDSAAIIAYTPERVEISVRTAEPALLVLTDTHYPGWVATVDGVGIPIYATNYLFRGVSVPAGERTVVFEYRPVSWQQGLWLSGLGGLLCLGLIAYNVRRPLSGLTAGNGPEYGARSDDDGMGRGTLGGVSDDQDAPVGE